MNGEKKLNDKTTVPIGWVFALLSAAGGGLIASVSVVLYFSSINNTAQGAYRIANDAQSTTHEISDKLTQINERLSRIEGAIPYLRKIH
jgi:hypothetical protein